MTIRVSQAAALVMLSAVAACKIERTPRSGLPNAASIARAEIEITLNEYERAVFENDARRAASFFVPTAQLHLPDTPALMGRRAIDETLSSSFVKGRVVAIEMESEEVDIGAGVASQFGSFRQRVVDASGKEQQVTGRFVIRWLRLAESAWQIERMMLNHYPADSTELAVR